jgi:hypothetical protein
MGGRAERGQCRCNSRQVIALRRDEQVQIPRRSGFGVNANGIAAEQCEPNPAADELLQQVFEVGV